MFYPPPLGISISSVNIRYINKVGMILSLLSRQELMVVTNKISTSYFCHTSMRQAIEHLIFRVVRQIDILIF